MKLENQTIFIISNEPWNDIWYSKHNYANELSKKNTVYFINPTSKWAFSNIFKRKIKLKNVSQSLIVIDYCNFLPANEKRPFLFNLNETILTKQFNRFIKKKLKSKPIFWSFDPYRFINPNKLNIKLSIFFIADKYLNLSFYTLIKNVDLILLISPSFESINGVNKKNYIVLNHSLPDLFCEINEDYVFPKNILKNYILFVGSIDFRLDFQLIETWIKNNPDKQFLFVGPLKVHDLDTFGKDIFIEKKYNNLMYLNPIPFSDIKNYIAKSIVCIAPMKMDLSGNDINHQKLIQYLIWGKPIVSPLFSDYKENNKFLYDYKNTEESLNALNLAWNEEINCVNKSERINFAKQFTFSNQFLRIETLINQNAHLIRNSK